MTKKTNAIVELTPRQMDVLYAAAARDLTTDEQATITALAQKVAHVDPRAKGDSRSYAYSTGPSVV